MYVWLILIAASALIGFISACFIKKHWAIYLAGVVPWLGVLAAILYTEYVMPYQGGGASMWPIAQFFGGGIATVTGVVSFKVTRYFIDSKH